MFKQKLKLFATGLRTCVFCVFKRGIVILCVVGLLHYFLVNHNLLKGKTLNSIRPDSFNYLFDVAENPEKLNNKKLWQYVYYYKKLVDFMPNRADAYGTLGLCYYHLGKTRKAILNYKKAVFLAPQFFWFYHNLGVIHYHNKNYEEAAKYLKEAIALQLDESITFLSMSKTYRPMLQARAVNSNEKLMARLKRGYRNAYVLLVLSYKNLEDYEEMYRYANAAVNENVDQQAFFNYYAGVGAFMLKGFGRAALFLNKSIALSPKNADVFYYLGLALRETGMQQVSEHALAQSVELRKKKIPLDMVNESDIQPGIF